MGIDNKELEKAAASYGNINYPIPYGYIGTANDFINGAKWQEKRMYNEEEVLNILDIYHNAQHSIDPKPLKKWFEQFKK
jgi:hypothetical protein